MCDVLFTLVQQKFPEPAEEKEWKDAVDKSMEYKFPKYSVDPRYMAKLQAAGFLMTETIHGTDLEIRDDFTSEQFADFIIDDVFPDIYEHLNKACQAQFKTVQKDEFIPVLHRYTKLRLVDLPKRITGKVVWDNLLIKTNHKTSRLAFGE